MFNLNRGIQRTAGDSVAIPVAEVATQRVDRWRIRNYEVNVEARRVIVRLVMKKADGTGETPERSVIINEKKANGDPDPRWNQFWAFSANAADEHYSSHTRRLLLAVARLANHFPAEVDSVDEPAS